MSRSRAVVCLGAFAAIAGCAPAAEPSATPPPPTSSAVTLPPIASAPAAPSATASATAVASASASASVAPVVAMPPPVFPEPTVTIPRGWFTMGCPKTADSVCGDEEKPRHRVLLSPYEIDVNEVTVGHYNACIDAGACKYPMGSLNESWLNDAQQKVADSCRDQFRPEHSKLPMVCINMGLANEYCEWRDKRLPTEAEWERAARGDGTPPGGERLFPWGDEPPDAERACVQTQEPCEVGSHPAGVSPYGLHDMAGNAAEWVWDFFDKQFYASSPVRDPDGTWDLLPVDKRSCHSATCKTVRGGSWQDEPLALRSTARKPEADGSVWMFSTIGFRCARSTEAKRREYFANRANMWNSRQIRRSEEVLKRALEAEKRKQGGVSPP